MKVFISYRREDSAGHTGRLYDSLRQRFGEGEIFLDLSGIDSGQNFVTVINTAIHTCDVLLAVIGKEWLTCTASGRRRIDDPGDLVRGEIVTALAGHIPVIPVLVGGAAPPGATALPLPLQPLATIDAHEITDERWAYDVGRLIEAIEKAAGGTAHRGARRTSWWGAAALVGLMLAVGGVILAMQHASRAGAGSVPGTVDAAAVASRISGEWSAEVPYDWGATHRESLALAVDGNTVTGTASFLGVPRGIVGGHVDGDRVAFDTRTQEVVGGASEAREVVHHYRGRITGEAIAFSMQSEGGSSDVPVAFTATRTAR